MRRPASENILKISRKISIPGRSLSIGAGRCVPVPRNTEPALCRNKIYPTQGESE